MQNPISKAQYCSIVLLLSFIAALHVRAADKPDEKKPPAIPKLAWYSNLGQALTAAREKDMRVLLLLELPDETQSRELLAEFSDNDIATAAVRFIPVRLNVRMESQLLDNLVVHLVPDLRVFAADGRQVAHQAGLLDKAALKKFLDDAVKAAPDKTAPALSMLFPGAELDSFLALESKNDIPGQHRVEKLLELAGGANGETRIEAQRLLRLWSRRIAGHLIEALSQKNLKPRITAAEALAEISAPLDGFDPWAGPASEEVLKKLSQWTATAQKIEKTNSQPVTLAPLPANVEADLKELIGGDPALSQAAWQRLVATGRSLVPVLRRRARDIAGQQPSAAVKYDELRFRILLSAEALRRQPGVAQRLASGSTGGRAAALGTLLRSGISGLADLARESICDADPLFRETAVRNLTAVLEDPNTLLRDALKDPEPNVRVAALTVMANTSNKENAAALSAYLASEPDSDMICHAVVALGSVKSHTSKMALRNLIGDPRWQVRAAAIEAIGALSDNESRDKLAERLLDEDGFVAARSVEALAKFNDASIVQDLGEAVKKHPEITVVVLKALRNREMRKAKSADKLLRSFTSNEVPEVRAEALRALAADDERPAYDEVAAGLKDPSVTVRSAAVEGMRSLIRREALLPLIEKNQLPKGYLDVREMIVGMLKETDEKTRLEAALTLAYFGDWKLALPVLKTFLLYPQEAMRHASYAGLRELPGEEVLNMVKLRIERKDLNTGEGELSSMIGSIVDACRSRASEWQPNEPVVEAMFALLPYIPDNHVSSWFTHFTKMGFDSEHSDKPDEKNRRALAKFLTGRIEQIPAGKYRNVVRLIWMKTAELDENRLKEFIGDENADIRRMAYALQFRANEKGPKELVLSGVKDSVPEIRRLAVAAAIPATWRRYIEDPTNYDFVLGEQVYDYGRSYSYSSSDKVPKVIELPVPVLEQLLKDDDEEVRVNTAFLMAMEGGDQGIDVLAAHWRSGRNKYRATETFKKAVVLAWDDSLAPHLDALYDQYKNEERDYYLKEFYREIGELEGVRVKKLRTRIRRDFPDVAN